MNAWIISLVLPLLAAAAPAAYCPSLPPPPFTITAIRPASPIQHMQMNAGGLKFWLGGQTSSYCPTQVGICPPGNQTVFIAGGSYMVSTQPPTTNPPSLTYNQDVEVPGGQQVYVDPSGALSFTQAHSIYIPPGSAIPGVVYEPGKPWSHLTGHAFGADGFMACPTPDHRWQVFVAMQNATVPSGNVNDCLDFSARTVTYNGPFPAWQYA